MSINEDIKILNITYAGDLGSGPASSIILKNKIIRLDFPIESFFDWYDNSVILIPKNNINVNICTTEGEQSYCSNQEVYQNNSPFVCTTDGEIISLDINGPYDAIKYCEPLNFTDGIINTGRIIYRYTFQNPAREVWQSQVNFLNNIPDNARLDFQLISKSENQWEYKYDITFYDGQKQIHTISLNTETGAITEI